MRSSRNPGTGNSKPATGTNPALAVIVFCLLLPVACDQGPPADRLLEGRPFPQLVLVEFDGGERSIAEYRGRLVVLNVWATWCAPCRKELPSLERMNARLDPDRFAVIGMSVDSDIDIAQEYLLDRGITFKSYIDLNGEAVSDLLEIRVYPDTFIISPDGVLLRKIVGERDWEDPELLEALRAAAHGDIRQLQAM